MPTAFPTSSHWTKITVGVAIVLAASTIMSNQLKTQTTPKTSLSSHLSSAKEGDVIQDLENERNRIAVENKSASELFRSLLVYRICTINPLVNVAPKLIHLAEMMHCSPPVYWTIRKTFFVQFCG